MQVRFSGGPTGAPLWFLVTLDPAHPDAPEPAEAFDGYGAALAVGDFDADGYDDLAVGIPENWGESLNGIPAQVGGVQIHYGRSPSDLGIQVAAEHFLDEGSPGVVGEPFSEERFGHALAVGDFNGDGHDDLAIGASGDWVFAPRGVQGGQVHVAHGHAGGAGEDDAGKVLVVYGSPASLVLPDHRYFGSLELGGESQPGMRFGQALAAGDFDGDGRDDLAIGSPRFDGQGTPQPVDMGLVAVAYGPPLDSLRVHWIDENVLYGPGAGEANDSFGWALAAGDFDGDGVDDLAVGTPGEDIEAVGIANTGAVSVVPGQFDASVIRAPRQLRPVGGFDVLTFQDPAGLIPDYRGGAPIYGWALAAGDFDGNGFADLAIGAPTRDRFDPSHIQDAGAVAVLYGQLFADGFEAGSLHAWSSPAR